MEIPPRTGVGIIDSKSGKPDRAVLGHEVRSVHDGPRVLEVAESFRPEIVLLDRQKRS
jgi:hypothetical protein